MKPTNTDSPDHYHQVVNCQYACPAHTPVPEYIRLIAQRRYTDAYMVNWEANVFPGILAFVDENGVESFVALSAGVLTKSGSEVLVSARRAVRSEQLGELQLVVRDDFRSVDERERVARTVIARLEADFTRRFLILEEMPRV